MGSAHESLGGVGFTVMLVALKLKIMSIPVISISVVCILGTELLLVLLMRYLI
jgi:hypothetical protein